jgi:hypothetical protein
MNSYITILKYGANYPFGMTKKQTANQPSVVVDDPRNLKDQIEKMGGRVIDYKDNPLSILVINRADGKIVQGEATLIIDGQGKIETYIWGIVNKEKMTWKPNEVLKDSLENRHRMEQINILQSVYNETVKKLTDIQTKENAFREELEPLIKE